MRIYQHIPFQRSMLRQATSALGVFLGVFGLTAMAPLSAADSYLYVWANDGDEADSDFLAVIDANPQSANYGAVLATKDVGMAVNAHHTEHRMPADKQLFMNGFKSGETFIMDLRDPLKPSIVAQFSGMANFSHAHSFERAPNGNVIATFQNGPNAERVTGGLVEIDPSGNLVRSAPGAAAGFPEIRPYSLAIAPEKDVIVTSTHDMRAEVIADAVQFWRLSDLSLKKTIRLPAGPQGYENHYPVEPRLMDDGETLLVTTLNCGLYQIHDFYTDEPRAEHIYDFEFNHDAWCALPVTVGKYWIQTVPKRHGLVTLDLSDPSNPKEVSYVDLGDGRFPHWVAIDSSNERIVVTDFNDDPDKMTKVSVVNLDPSDGSLSIDKKFGDDGVVDFAREDWPHGSNGGAIPHGAVFSIP